MAGLLAFVYVLTHHLSDLTRFLNARGTQPYCVNLGTICIHITHGLTRRAYRVQLTSTPSHMIPVASAHANGREEQ